MPRWRTACVAWLGGLALGCGLLWLLDVFGSGP